LGEPANACFHARFRVVKRQMPDVPERHRQVLVMTKFGWVKTARFERFDQVANFIVGFVVVHDPYRMLDAGCALYKKKRGGPVNDPPHPA
jgi:hypothetical protein